MTLIIIDTSLLIDLPTIGLNLIGALEDLDLEPLVPSSVLKEITYFKTPRHKKYLEIFLKHCKVVEDNLLNQNSFDKTTYKYQYGTTNYLSLDKHFLKQLKKTSFTVFTLRRNRIIKLN